MIRRAIAALRSGFRPAIAALRSGFRRVVQGLHVCPCCGEQTCRMELNNPIHADGPPLVTRWRCLACDRATEWQFTSIMDQGARNLGYADAAHFFQVQEQRHRRGSEPVKRVP